MHPAECKNASGGDRRWHSAVASLKSSPPIDVAPPASPAAPAARLQHLHYPSRPSPDAARFTEHHMGLDLVSSGKDVPNEIHVVIEIPKDEEPVKYEVDKATGAIFVDRVLSTPMRYPCNYGYVPHTLCGDGRSEEH